MAKHFTDEHWSDYARGVAPDLETAAMRRHLDEGCEMCREAYQFWRTVAETAANEVHIQIPETLLHLSGAAYNEWRRFHLIPIQARIARVLSDSWLAPLPASARSGTSSHRRILGRVGRWSFDLHFEPSAGKRMFLTGQIVAAGPHHAVSAGLVILLMNADTVLAKTEANQFGEFSLQFVAANGLRVYADLPADRPIGIALPDMDSSPAGR